MNFTRQSALTIKTLRHIKQYFLTDMSTKSQVLQLHIYLNMRIAAAPIGSTSLN